jgi:hypothetical protein
MSMKKKKKKKSLRTRKHDTPKPFRQTEKPRRFVPRTREALEQPQNGSLTKNPKEAA